jgi:hypothetical protein
MCLRSWRLFFKCTSYCNAFLKNCSAKKNKCAFKILLNQKEYKCIIEITTMCEMQMKTILITQIQREKKT